MNEEMNDQLNKIGLLIVKYASKKIEQEFGEESTSERMVTVFNGLICAIIIQSFKDPCKYPKDIFMDKIFNEAGNFRDLFLKTLCNNADIYYDLMKELNGKTTH